LAGTVARDQTSHAGNGPSNSESFVGGNASTGDDSGSIASSLNKLSLSRHGGFQATETRGCSPLY
jgi:hypothetical protein